MSVGWQWVAKGDTLDKGAVAKNFNGEAMRGRGGGEGVMGFLSICFMAIMVKGDALDRDAVAKIF